MIKTCEAIAPAILWIDELEKGFSGTQSSGQTDGGTTSRVFASFITWLQEKTTPVFVIATANNVHQLPPELLRKGRFDEIFFCDLPDREDRRQIIDIHLRKKKRDPGQFDMDKLVDATVDYSGAELEQAVIAALYDAFDTGNDLDTEGLLKTAARDRAARDHDARDDRGDARVGAHACAHGVVARRKAPKKEGWMARYGAPKANLGDKGPEPDDDDAEARALESRRLGDSMSHFTKCALKMTNLAAIKKALADMQLKFTEAEQGQSVTVRGYRGDKLQAAISIDMGRYDIGVIDNQDGTYDITADWWGVETTKGVSEEEFKNQLVAEVPVSQRQTGLRREGLRGRGRGQRGGRLDPPGRSKVGEPNEGKQDIEIVINAKGEVTFQVKGVKGGSCLDETKFLEAGARRRRGRRRPAEDRRILRAIRGLRVDLGRGRQGRVTP